jgi:hypothetical protein
MNLRKFKEEEKNKLLLFFLCIFFFSFSDVAFAQQNAALSIGKTSTSDFVLVIQSSFHSDYGCMYPLTYQFDIPQGSSGLKVWKKYFSTDTWKSITEKTVNDFFNGIEAIRFDYPNNRAYISVVFSTDTDSLFLKITESNGNTIFPSYAGISKYYDNRIAAVTVSADDWSDWVVTDANHSFSTLLYIFRSYNLYVTVGSITNANNSSRATWTALQHQLDSGFVEVASHSRSHPNTPYSDPVGEVLGSLQDIRNALTLPPLFSMNGKKYVYTWIAPYGNYDSTVDSLLGVANYLTARLYSNLDTTSPRTYIYGDSTLADWDSQRHHFKAFWPSLEIGAPSWGGGDTSLTSLNGFFDTIVAKRDVYHIMWHPQVIYPDRNKSYLRNHLSYISNRKNIWYANLGHLYLYNLLRESSTTGITSVTQAINTPFIFQLHQNYPNPFNPATAIEYTLNKSGNIHLKVYDILGQNVMTIVNNVFQTANTYTQRIDMSRFTSGIYFCVLEQGSDRSVRKMMLLK